MKLSELTSADLQKLSKLISQRDSILVDLAEIEAQINSFTGGPEDRPKRGRPAGSTNRSVKGKRGPKKGEKPGRLKSLILKALKEAGNQGVSIKDLSQKLRVKSNNLYSWFYTTGRKVHGIKKSDEGKYSYHG